MLTARARRFFNLKRYFPETPTFQTLLFITKPSNYMVCIKCDLLTPREKSTNLDTHRRYLSVGKIIPYPIHILSKMQGALSKAPTVLLRQLAWSNSLVVTLQRQWTKGTGTQGRAFILSQLWLPSPPQKPVKDELIHIQTGIHNTRGYSQLGTP